MNLKLISGKKELLLTKITEKGYTAYKNDLIRLINVGSSLSVIEYIISKSNDSDSNYTTNLGEFLTVVYTLQVASNNLNALSKKFTGKQKEGLSNKEEAIQKKLLSIPAFKELVNQIFPSDVEGSWYRLDRLNSAHVKNLYEFYNMNKSTFKKHFFNNHELSNILSNIKEVFKEILGTKDIVLYKIEGEHLESFKVISDKFSDILRITSSYDPKYQDLILTNSLSLLIESLVSNRGVDKSLLEYNLCYKMLIQCASQAFKDFSQFYSGDDWNVTQNMHIFHQLRDYRNKIAHSEILHENFRFYHIEYYSLTTSFSGKNNLYKLMISSGQELRKVLNKGSEQSTNMSERHIEELEISAPLIEANSKIKGQSKSNSKKKKVRKKFISDNEEQFDIDIIIQNIKEEEARKGVKDEYNSYIQIKQKQIEYINDVYRSFFIANFSESLMKTLPYSVNKNSPLNNQKITSIEQLLVAKRTEMLDILDKISFEPSILLADSKTHASLTSILEIAFKDNIVKYHALNKLIKNGINLAEVSKAVGNILLLLIKGQINTHTQEDLKAYELILNNYPKEKIDSLINERNVLKSSSFIFQGLIGVYDNEIKDFIHDTNYRIVEGSVFSIASEIENPIDVLELFIKYGADINSNITIQILDLNKYLKDRKYHLEKLPIITFSVFNYLLESGKYEAVYYLINKDNFKLDSYKVIHKIFTMQRENMQCSIAELLCKHLIMNHDMKVKKLILDIGNKLYIGNKPFSDNSNYYDPLISPGIAEYKLAEEYNIKWLSQVVLKYIENVIWDGYNKGEDEVLEKLLEKYYPTKTSTKLTCEEFDLEKFYKPIYKFPLLKKFFLENTDFKFPFIKLFKDISNLVDKGEIDKELYKAWHSFLSEQKVIMLAKENNALPMLIDQKVKEKPSTLLLKLAIMKKKFGLVKQLVEYGEEISSEHLELAKNSGNEEILASLNTFYQTAENANKGCEENIENNDEQLTLRGDSQFLTESD
jgi:hypothetical protein